MCRLVREEVLVRRGRSEIEVGGRGQGLVVLRNGLGYLVVEHFGAEDGGICSVGLVGLLAVELICRRLLDGSMWRGGRSLVVQQVVAGVEVLASSVGYEAVCVDALPLALGAFSRSVFSIPARFFKLLQCFTQGVWVDGFGGFALSSRRFILVVGDVVIVVDVCTSMRDCWRSVCAGRRWELWCVYMVGLGLCAKLGFQTSGAHACRDVGRLSRRLGRR
jgi:hypothetical protein